MVNCKSKKSLDQYEIFSDILYPEFDIKWLYETYPNALYILNWRNLKDWLTSRWNHIRRNKFIKEDDPQANWTDNSKKEIKEWINTRNKHHYKMMNFFKDKYNFQIVNIDSEIEMLNFFNQFEKLNTLPEKSNVHKDKVEYIHEPLDVLECLEELNVKKIDAIISNYIMY